MPLGLYTSFLKRLFDLLLSISVLLLFTPLLLLVALAIKLTDPGPVLFLQERAGRGGKPFRLVKLRTMTHRDRKPTAEVLPGNPEVTRIGAILRRTKLDELPQLINVIKGDMSIVGPRPMLLEGLKSDDPNMKTRLLVRPGLTGLAQVNGNIYLSWPERFVYDAAYVQHLSLLLDIRIFIKTFLIVIKGEQWALKRPEPGMGASLV